VGFQDSHHRARRNSELLSDCCAGLTLFAQRQHRVSEFLQVPNLETLVQPQPPQVIQHGLVGESVSFRDGMNAQTLLSKADDFRTEFRAIASADVSCACLRANSRRIGLFRIANCVAKRQFCSHTGKRISTYPGWPEQ